MTLAWGQRPGCTAKRAGVQVRRAERERIAFRSWATDLSDAEIDVVIIYKSANRGPGASHATHPPQDRRPCEHANKVRTQSPWTRMDSHTRKPVVSFRPIRGKHTRVRETLTVGLD
jgi:hypothetical protein